METKEAPTNSPFIGELVLRVLPHWQLPDHRKEALYQLVHRFGYLSKTFGRIMVPEGFLTDMGSVPAMTKWLVDNDDPDLLYGAVIHDYLYTQKGRLPDRTYSRLEADDILREAMLAAGAPAFKTWLVYRCVRLAGGRNWSD